MDAPVVTTDQLAALLRARVVANPTVAITCSPGVDQLAAILTDRLPYIAADDIGAVLMHAGCYAADAMQIMRDRNGLNALLASQMGADILALAGEQLYTAGQRAANDRRNGGGN
jgi:hypothetical protein